MEHLIKHMKIAHQYGPPNKEVTMAIHKIIAKNLAKQKKKNKEVTNENI
tara:strand:- start:94 stop:240 length:147 start_codon:yes stop_codon:yes gene_type:complete